MIIPISDLSNEALHGIAENHVLSGADSFNDASLRNVVATTVNKIKSGSLVVHFFEDAADPAEALRLIPAVELHHSARAAALR